jgi:hypothetical protein
MTIQFIGIFVLTSELQRRLAKPLNPLQLQYLKILELTPDIFTKPPGRGRLQKPQHRKISPNCA